MNKVFFVELLGESSKEIKIATNDTIPKKVMIQNICDLCLLMC